MRKLSSISLKFEVTAVIVISLAIFSIVSALIFQRFSAFSKEIGVQATLLKEMQNEVSMISEVNQSLQFLVLNSTAGNATKDEKEQAFKKITEVSNKAQVSLEKIGKENLTTAFQEYNVAVKKSVDLLQGGDSLTAADLALKKLPPLYTQLNNAVETELVSTIKKFDSAIATLDKFTLWSIFILIALFFIFTISSYFIVEKILKPVYSAKMQLTGVIQTVLDAANTTQRDAVEVGSGGTIFSNDCNEIASSMEELKIVVNNNAKATHESAEFAEQSARASEKAQVAVEELTTSMKDVEGSVGEFITTINESIVKLNMLAGKITEIAEKTSVINDIVFQTRLLSFNASVEAARAGEQGKGFSVVAEEVGKLAAVSGTSAQEIQSLVQQGVDVAKGLVDEISSKVKTVSASVKNSVENGARNVSTTVLILDQVTSNMHNLREFMDRIDKSSKEQESGIKRVSELVVHLSETAVQNNSLSQNMQKNAGVLIHNSDQLIDVSQAISSVLEGKTSQQESAGI